MNCRLANLNEALLFPIFIIVVLVALFPMRLARFEGRKSFHISLSVAFFIAHDLSRLGTWLKVEAVVAVAHSTSTLRTSISSSIRKISPSHFQQRSLIHTILGHVRLAGYSAIVRPVFVANIFEAVHLILFSTLYVIVQDSHLWRKLAIVVDRHRSSRSFSGSSLSVSVFWSYKKVFFVISLVAVLGRACFHLQTALRRDI